MTNPKGKKSSARAGKPAGAQGRAAAPKPTKGTRASIAEGQVTEHEKTFSDRWEW